MTKGRIVAWALGLGIGSLMGCDTCWEACQLEADLFAQCNDGMDKSMLCWDDETEAPTRSCQSRADVVESCGNMQEKSAGILGDQYVCDERIYDPDGMSEALSEGDCCRATQIYIGQWYDPDDCDRMGEW